MNSKAVYTTSNTTDKLRYCKYNIELLGICKVSRCLSAQCYSSGIPVTLLVGKKHMWVGDLLLASRLACFDKLALRSLHSC